MVAEGGLSQVYVLLGNGDGTFGSPVGFGSVNQPFGVAVADIDGDGNLDLVVTNSANASIATFFGNGDGTFQQQTEYAAGGYSYAVAVADFNGDGAPDIAVANTGPFNGISGDVAILLNNGNGTFAEAVTYGAGGGAYFLSAEDMNGDGYVDLVVAARYPSPQTLIYLGNGNGTFNTTPVALSTGSTVYFNAVADLNGDGAPDIVAANDDSNPGNISILLQTVAPILSVAPSSLSYTLNSEASSPSSLTISNAGTGAASWTAATSQPWLSLSQTAGTAPSSVTVSVNPSGLTPGTYNATITLSAAGVSNSPLSVPVSLTVTTPPVVVSMLAFNPTNFVGPSTFIGTVTLSGPAPANGTIVTLSSNSSVVQAPPSITIPAGAQSVNFVATASAPTSLTPVTVMASLGGGSTAGYLTVQASSGTVASTTTLTSSPTSVPVGQSVTLIATVAPATATGSVSFTDGTTTLGSTVISSGVATLIVSNFAIGPHALMAVYSGNKLYGSSVAMNTLQVTSCATVSSAPVYFDSIGGETQLSVSSPPSCSWTTSADSAWIGTRPQSGVGNGALNIVVGPFNGGVDQSGNALVSVAGQGSAAVPVTQKFTAQLFSDVLAPTYYFDAVNLLKQRNITAGCTTTTYCPTENVTRAQMAVFIVRAALGGDSFSYSPTPYFTDVPVGAFGFQWIQKMYELGITNGCGIGLFCPNSDVTRAQMAIFIIRMRYGSNANFDFPSTPYFTDVGPTTFGFNWIQRMKEDNITSGCTLTTYCPNNPVTRGDMAIFIMRGGFNQLLPPTEPVLVSISPATIAQGASGTFTVTGLNTNFVQGVTTITPIPGITVGTVTVTTPTVLTVQLTAASGAVEQPVSVVAITGTPPGNEEAVIPNGLVIP